MPVVVPAREVFAMADLVPHPLVTRLGMSIARETDVPLPWEAREAASTLHERATLAQEANKQAADAQAAAARPKAPPAPPPAAASTPSPFDPIDIDDLYARQKQDLATALANKPDLPDLSLFAGFLGGKIVNRANGGEWRLIYLDARLYSWLLVREDDILVHQRLQDDRAPSGLRDVLWIRGTAKVVQGSGARSNEGRFLVGEFTRAGDFAASTAGGTFSAASGLVCEATTPGCCVARRTG
jgi:hypothetical protein